MPGECNGVCHTLPNAHGMWGWEKLGRRYCARCKKAFDVPPGTTSYDCKCCNTRTRGKARER